MKTIHTIKDITSGLKSVTLADLLKVADKKGVSPDEVFVSVSDSRWSEYRDLELTVVTKPIEESYVKEVSLPPKNKEVMGKYYKISI